MADIISREIDIEWREKLGDGTYLKKNPQTKASQVIANNGTTVEQHLADDNAIKHKAKTIALEDASNKFTATNVESGMLELFTNVSNGKNLVGGAITDVDDSVVIPTDPTFGDLASAIGNISTGKKWASGTLKIPSNSVTTYSFDIIGGFDFKPSMVFYYAPTSGLLHGVATSNMFSGLGASSANTAGTWYMSTNDKGWHSSNDAVFEVGSVKNIVCGWHASGLTIQWFAFE